jgi:predicted transcriptional regulator
MPPDEHGLGPLEMRVLGLLDPTTPISVQAMQEALAASGHELAYTTVMTVLGRLHEKGLVLRAKDGRRYLYRLGKRAPAMSQGIVSRIQRALFPGDRAAPLLALLDDDALSDEDLRAMRAKIDARLRGRSK